MTAIRVAACAKINLNLKILGRRSDGFHELESVLQTISLHDTLQIEPGGDRLDLSVTATDDRIPGNETNLVWRAAAALGAGGPDRGLRIHLQKGVPSGAGLGGGSSDSAATLLTVRRIWAGQDDDGLHRQAERLGTDVPFFLVGGTALVTGRGTVVHPLADQTGYELLVVCPGMPLPTAGVYAQLQEPLTPAGKIDSMTRFVMASDFGVEAGVRAGNDLEPHAVRLCPAIGEIKERLLRSGATAAAMTGSGSAVFGVFRVAGSRDGAADEMIRCGWAAYRCAPVGRREYRRRLGLA